MINHATRCPLFEALEPRLLLDGGLAPASEEIGTTDLPNDTDGPVVVSHSPSGFVPESGGRVEVVFNEPINGLTFTVQDVMVTIDALLLYVEVQDVEPLDDTTFLIVFDDPRLRMDYHVWIGPEIEDLAGNPMAEPYEATYVVQGPPRVTDLRPAPDTTENLVSSAVARFSQDMDPRAIDAKSFWIARDPGEDGEYGTNDDVIVDADVTYSPATRTASCVPFVERLWPGEYAVVLTDRMTDTLGQHLDGEWPGTWPGFPSGDGQEGGTFVSTFVVADYGRIEGAKWHDLNGNGRWEDREPGLADWTICLQRAADVYSPLEPPVQTTRTRADGTYTFYAVPPGTYTVWEQQPAGWEVRCPASGLYTVTLDWEQVVEGIDFGNAGPYGSVEGVKWLDTDLDGIREATTEPGLRGWTVYIDLDRDGAFDPSIEPHAVTGNDGGYTIDRVPVGVQVVSEVLQAGWTQTFPHAGAHLVDQARRQLSQTTGALDSGIHAVGPAPAGRTPYEIGITAEVVWSHASSELRPELTEFSVNGDQITIDLYGYNPDVVLPVVETEYHTVNVGALDLGTYEITATLHEQNAWLPAFIPTWRATGTMIVAEDGSHVVHLAPGEAVEDVDFGNYASGSIYGRKWHDLDGDGEWDYGEPGLANWTIYLDLNENGQLDDGEPTTRTLPTDPLADCDCDLTGVYVFRDVPPGEYVVAEVIPDGWRQTYPREGVHKVTVPPAGAVWDVDFGNLSLNGRICGAKWLDMDQDGVRSHGEPGLEGWRIYIDADRDGQYDAPQPGWTRIIDPMGAPGPIEDPMGFAEFVEAVGGGVVVGTKPWLHGASLAGLDLVFGWVRNGADGVNRYESTWLAGEAVLRVDFDEPVSAVMLDFLGTPIRGGHQGVLNAFTADGELLQSVHTEIIWGLGFEAVSIFRDASEIAYIEATGAGEWNPIQMDRLQFAVMGTAGEPSAVTGEDGLYCIGNVPAGEHVVAEVPQPGWWQTYPVAFAELTASRSWQVADGAAIDFDLTGVTLSDGTSVSGAVYATFEVTWPDTSWSLVSDYTNVRIVGKDVYVDLYSRDYGIGLMVIWEERIDVPIHLPAAGEYTIHAELNEEVGPTLPAFHTTWQAEGEMVYEPLAAHRVWIDPGETVEGVDFGNYAAGAIHGVKWHDVNGNGRRDPHEPGLPGWVIYVDLNHNGSLDNYEPHAVTMADDPYTDFDEAGLYTIGEVPPGWHRVAEIQHAGWGQTYPDDGAHHVRVIPNASIPDVDFGNRDRTPPWVIDACCNDGAVDASTLSSLEVTFSEDVAVSPSALALRNVTRDEPVVLETIPPAYDSGTRKAVWDLTGVDAPYGDVLRATVGASGVTDVVGLPMEADYELEFRLAAPGDANLDASVDHVDYLTWKLFAGSGAVWEQTDFDDSGTADGDDLALIEEHFNFSSPEGTSAAGDAAPQAQQPPESEHADTVRGEVRDAQELAVVAAMLGSPEPDAPFVPTDGGSLGPLAIADVLAGPDLLAAKPSPPVIVVVRPTQVEWLRPSLATQVDCGTTVLAGDAEHSETMYPAPAPDLAGRLADVLAARRLPLPLSG